MPSIEPRHDIRESRPTILDDSWQSVEDREGIVIAKRPAVDPAETRPDHPAASSGRLSVDALWVAETRPGSSAGASAQLEQGRMQNV
ncbi:hypothetical protein [Bradyrhizobium sp. USDA 4451]